MKLPLLLSLKALAVGGMLALGGISAAHPAEPLTPAARTTPMPTKARAKRTTSSRQWNFDVPPMTTARPYTAAVVGEHAQALTLDLTVVAVAMVYIGIDQWGWGDTGFHGHREGWFGRGTAYAGVDKLGHAWSAQVMSDYFTWRLRSMGYARVESAATAALITAGAFLAIEVGDGFSHFGFSYEDFIASSLGAGISFLRNTVPGLAEKVDFRMQYIPTGQGDRLGLGDYSGKKFLLAWKFAGFESFRDGPFRYLEIHTGYYARGYSTWEAAAGVPQTRTPYIGVGLNLAELLFSDPKVRDSFPGEIARSVLSHYQVPYTYVASDGRYP